MRSSSRRRMLYGSYVALLGLVLATTWYAVTAEADDADEPHLHDSGVWVVNDTISHVGRLDKAIGQLDGAYYAAGSRTGQLDVVQEDAAVAVVDRSLATMTVIDPRTVAPPEGEVARIPNRADVQLRGGSLAVVETGTGKVWASRVGTGPAPSVTGMGRSKAPITTVGKDTLLAVTSGGTVVGLSLAEHTLVTLAVEGRGYAAPNKRRLRPLPVGTGLTTVGERPVLLTPDGRLSVVDGATADLPAGSVLQQPGPADHAVLVATPESGLLEVDLDSGEWASLGKGSGEPVAPLRLGACGYGAWTGADPRVVTKCDGSESLGQPLAPSPKSTLVFRTNRGQVVLNDNIGQVWDADSHRLTSPDDWNAFRAKPRIKRDPETEDRDTGHRDEAQANPDETAARPGRTVILHPLDNDVAPDGRLISLQVVGSEVHGGTATASPDGQVVQARLAGERPLTFTYALDDGDRRSAPVESTVTVRPAHGNRAPQLRPHYHDPDLSVATGADIDVPVLREWRDPESDPVSIGEVSTSGESTARVLDGGIIRFTASSTPGRETLTYAVTDGELTTTRQLDIQVQGPGDTVTRPPIVAPDVAVGLAERPILIRPLANDIAGSDPGDPSATLALNGAVVAPPGVDAVTDEAAGTVTVTADVPGSYLLDYEAGFGNADFAAGIIRVDVSASDESAAPVAMPDTVNVYGDQAATVDALLNDTDPAGGLLTIESAQVDGRAATVSVVDGRFVSIEPTGAGLTDPVEVRYVVGNGKRMSTGTITASPRTPPQVRTPVTAVDRVTVRAGAGVEVPVLDNDADPLGGQLTLAENVVPEHAGALPVSDGEGRTEVDRVGAATVAGDFVRYVAPAGAEDGRAVTVDYVAQTTTGETSPGRLIVTVRGQRSENHPPTPPRLEARVSAGGLVEIELPRAQVDPDGDPVTISGVTKPPVLGRIVDTRADTIVYQAYPDSSDSTGTDEFTYQVTDELGLSATGTVKVAITAPVLPSPPQAVADEVSAAPGRTVLVDVLANDHVDVGGSARVRVPKGQPQASLRDGLVAVEVPADRTGDVTATYQLSNGAGSTTGEITVHAVPGYNSPPVVDDVIVNEEEGDRVVVDLLSEAYDPDGPFDGLRVVQVSDRGVVTGRAGSRVTLLRTKRPRVVPFRVADRDGGVTTATVMVPARTGVRPVLLPDARIELKAGTQVKRSLDEVAESSTGGEVRFTDVTRTVASPAGLDVDITGPTAFTVSAQPGVSGPGAVSFEVTTGTDAADATGRTQMVTVPVQVGGAAPVLTCPDGDQLEIVEGSRLDVPVASVCQVWTPDPSDAGKASLDAEVHGGGGVNGQLRGGVVHLSARDGSASQQATVTLTVTSHGLTSAPARLAVTVIAAPSPRLSAATVGDLRAGQSRELDLAPYFTPGIAGRRGRVLRAAGVAGARVGATPLGGSRVRITAPAGVDGDFRIRVVMTDLSGGRVAPARRVTGTIKGSILDRPDKPGAPVLAAGVRSRIIALSWRAPDANGSPIDSYRVTSDKGRSWTCRSTSCVADGLANGEGYRFRVSAHNAVGWSPASGWSARGVPDDTPGAVRALRLTSVGSRTLTVHWAKPTKKTSLQGYRVSWPGGAKKVPVAAATIAGLDNNRSYPISVVAYNKIGLGPIARTAPLQSVGTPAAPAAPSIVQASNGDYSTLRLRWGAVSPNGPGPVRYTVLKDGAAVGACRHILALTCSIGGVRNDGSTHAYRVRATNAGVPGVRGGQRRSATGGTASYAAVGSPAPWTAFNVAPTGKDQQFRVSGTIPASRGAVSNVTVYRGTTPIWGPRNVRGQLQTYVGILTTTTDDAPVNVWARVTNEAGRSASSPLRTVQTYGPLTNRQIISLKPTVDGDKISWTATVNGNGAKALVTIRKTLDGYSGGFTRGPVTVGRATRSVSTGMRIRAKRGQCEYITVTIRDEGSAPARSGKGVYKRSRCPG